MSIIKSFLQKRRMHENQHGFVMVVMAYALSFVMLVVGSDVFYNINSEAAGLNEEANEEADETDNTDQVLNQQILMTAMSRQASIINPYGIANPEDEPTASDNKDYTSQPETIWLMGSAVTKDQYSGLLEEMGKIQSLSLTQNVAEDDSEAAQTEPEKEKAGKDEAKGEADKKSDKDKDASKAKEASSSYVIKVSKEEIAMLERIVEAEASGEDMKGKILVANVVINRIKDEEFPDTIEGVIFHKVKGKYQFSPVASKRYYKVKVSKETKEAVIRALEGEDYSKGALYFMARKKSKKSNTIWFDNNLKKLFQHGGHEFYKNK